jgi:uncharacterized Zn-finger protein
MGAQIESIQQDEFVNLLSEALVKEKVFIQESANHNKNKYILLSCPHCDEINAFANNIISKENIVICDYCENEFKY